MRIALVSHFHWDREWYRTFEAYRARLADAVDRVLELLAADPGYRFVLDGQTVLLEDYLAVRPARRAALIAGVRSGRLGIGPWYVQPDMLLPSGEALIRNLLEGRRVAAEFGAPSCVAYVPDSFGHPAQAPQLFAGFGMARFVHWRGSGNEVDAFGDSYRWLAPDGSAVAARLLRDGYFNAACLPADADEAARRLVEMFDGRGTDAPGRSEVVLLMNGFDHMLPDAHTGAVAAALAQRTGAPVDRVLLDDALDRAAPVDLPIHRGELLGGRLASLLPGVWSTRIDLKLRNRRCETLLGGWLEPWTAFGRRLGTGDERPALRLAWREVVQNQAHDSICGCSLDAVAAQVEGRYAAAEGLAGETLQRLLERLAGQDVERRTPDAVDQTLVVFNPSPHRRTDVVRIALDAYPPLRLPVGMPEFPPLLLAIAEGAGFAVDGVAARLVASDDPSRPRWMPDHPPLDVEFVAADVPAFGCRRFALTRAERVDDVVDDGREITAGAVGVRVADDGTVTVRFGDRERPGLFGLEDRGDRGDTYDFDPLDGDPGARLRSATWQRRIHPSGVAELSITRVVDVPRGLDTDRQHRTPDTVGLVIVTDLRVAPGVARVDVRVRVDNPARDHRLRLLFPTGAPTPRCRAAAMFDVVERPTAAADDRGWQHGAPSTFPHQGWVAANRLTVVAPGLPEAEVRADGTIAITLLRAVGWIARFDLRSRPVPAGPPMVVDGAQVAGQVTAELALLPDEQPRAAAAATLPLRGVLGGPAPLLGSDIALLALEPPALLLSAVKPAEEGEGIVVRVLNPTDAAQTAVLRFGLPIAAARAVRLDECDSDDAVRLSNDTLTFAVPAHALRSVLITSAA